MESHEHSFWIQYVMMMEQTLSVRAADTIRRLVPFIADRRLQDATRTDLAFRCVELMQGVPESFQLDFELPHDTSLTVRAVVEWMHLSFDVSDERLARMIESLGDHRWAHRSIEWWMRGISRGAWLDPTREKLLAGVLGDDAVELRRWILEDVDRSRALADLLGHWYGSGDACWLTARVSADVEGVVNKCRAVIGDSWRPIEHQKPQMKLPAHDEASLSEVRQILRSIPIGQYQEFPTRLGVLPGSPDQVDAALRTHTYDAVVAGIGTAKYDDWVSTLSAISEDCIRFGQLRIEAWLEFLRAIVEVTPPDDIPLLVSEFSTPLAQLLRDRRVTWNDVCAVLASCDRSVLTDSVAVLVDDPLLAEDALLSDSTRPLAASAKHRFRRRALAAALIAAVPSLSPLSALPQFPMFSWNRDRVWSFLHQCSLVNSDVFVRQGWLCSREWEALRTLSRRVEACVAVSRLPVEESVDCWDSVVSLGS